MRKDAYLNNFVSYCKKRFDNLVAIIVYGSYAWGYFDKKKSDYDVFVIFKGKVPRGKTEIRRKFKRISLPYFCSTDFLEKRKGLEHWASYITLIKVGKTLYKTKDYEEFLEKLKRRNLLKEKNISAIKRKIKYEKNALIRLRSFKALKWAFSSIRKRLSLLSYVKNKKLIWKFEEVLFANKNFLTKNEIDFLKELERKIKKRDSEFNQSDKKNSLKILEKIDKELLTKLHK